MAIPLSSKTNVVAPGGDYPYGNIKDNDGSNNGTPVNVEVYADFHQYFARMLGESGIVANGLPDNSANGFQYYLALLERINTLSLAQILSFFNHSYQTTPSEIGVSEIGSTGYHIWDLPSRTVELNLSASPTYNVVTFGDTAPKGIPYNILWRSTSGSFTVTLNSTNTSGYPMIKQNGVAAANTSFSIPTDQTFQVIRHEDWWEIYGAN